MQIMAFIFKACLDFNDLADLPCKIAVKQLHLPVLPAPIPTVNAAVIKAGNFSRVPGIH